VAVTAGVNIATELSRTRVGTYVSIYATAVTA